VRKMSSRSQPSLRTCDALQRLLPGHHPTQSYVRPSVADLIARRSVEKAEGVDGRGAI